MQHIASGTNSEVFLLNNNSSIVIKKYKSKSLLLHELKIFRLTDKTRHIIKPIDYDLKNLIVKFPRLTPLNYLDFRLLDPNMRYQIIQSIMLGIKELHALRIIHNDLKIDNILYNPIDLSVKIIDFSSSFIIDEYRKINCLQKKKLLNSISPLHCNTSIKNKNISIIQKTNELMKIDLYACSITILQLFGLTEQNLFKIKNKPIHQSKIQFKKIIQKLKFQFPQDKKILEFCQKQIFNQI
jgi:serine/threonine protein kinase